MTSLRDFFTLKWFRAGRLQVRLTALVLLIASVLLIAAVSLITLRAQSQMQKDADERLKLANRALTLNTGTWLDLNIRALEQLVKNPDIISMNPTRQKPLLVAMQRAYPHMYLISTVNLDGLNVSRSDDTPVKDYEDRAWFLNARIGQPVSFQTLVGRTSGEPALVVSVPIKDEDNKIIGVGMFATDLTIIAREVQATQLGTSGQAYIIDNANQLIAHTDATLTSVLHDYSNDVPVVTMRKDNRFQGTLNYTDAQGEEWHTNVSRLPNGWIIVVRQQESELLSPLHQFQQLAVAALVIGLLLLTVLSWWMIRRTLRPIALLTQTAKTIARGDLDQEAPVVSHDEIGVLAQTFNSMTAQLRGLIGTLEQRVAARTRDLEIAGEVARQITTVLDRDELLQQVVQSTAQSFGYYASEIFLFDPETELLTRVAGANHKGEQLTRRRVEIPLSANPSIIAQAARMRRPYNVSDVTQSPAYLPMPDLPDTHAEIAIPMLLGERLLGVFNVQSDTVNAFSKEDEGVLTTLAEQIAIAVRNAQLFEETKEARDDAERANKVKSQFLAAMSHELRTPLNGILNFTQFVSSGMMGPVTERQVEFLNKATTNGEHLLSLINDVLDISKIESGSLQLFVEDNVQINSIIENVVATGESMLVDKEVKLKVEIEPDLPPLRADERRIAQVLHNIVSNACKFTETGTITIRAKRNGKDIKLEVEDSGPGIAPDEQAAVFEVFAQTETGLRSGGGTGLGMPISRRLVESHGGRLWLESTVGKGTIFYVTLPLESQLVATV